MKNLTEFIKESLILELSSETYKNAFDKAKSRGDKRAEKFLDAYAKALKSEIPDTDELKDEINKWYKEDKIKFAKLRKLGIDTETDNGYIYLSHCTENGLNYIPRLKSVKSHGYTNGWSRFLKRYFDIDSDNINGNEENYLLGFDTYDSKTKREYGVKYFNGKSSVIDYDATKDEYIKDLTINDLPENIKDPIVKAIKILEPEAKI